MSLDRGYLLVATTPNPDSARPYWGLERLATYDLWQSFSEGTLAYAAWKREITSGIEDDEWCQFLATADLALALQKEYQQAGVEFDVLAVRRCDSDAAAAEEIVRPGFLGFDVAEFELRSVIYGQLLYSRSAELSKAMPETAADRSDPAVLDPVFELLKAYFVPRLGQNGLFQEYIPAALLRDTIMALEAVAPECFVPQWGDVCVFGLRLLGGQDES